MKYAHVCCSRPLAWAALALALALSAGSASANDRPVTEKWWPSVHGADDQRGAANWIGTKQVLDAVRLVRQGKVIQLGKIYAGGIPKFGQRLGWGMTLPGLPTGGPFPGTDLVYNDEMVTAELGQIGTQLDGLGHIGLNITGQPGMKDGNYFYNGNRLEDFGDTYGLKKLGIENAGPFVTRGVLIDAAGLRGMARLPIPSTGKPGDPGLIYPEDIQAALKKQGTPALRQGDVVIIHTGWGSMWGGPDWDAASPDERAKRTAMFNSGEPGIGITACRWLAGEVKVAMTASDNWSVEAVPGEGMKAFECHAELGPRYGVYNFENLQTEQLVQEKVYEFLFAWAPLRMKGATGSPGNPLAVY
jgi:kynurenine formamidase